MSKKFSLRALRKNCPCAQCRELRDEVRTNRLAVLTDSGDRALSALSASLVGNYALKIEWSDGHSAGIYTFEMLRKFKSDM